MMDVIFPLYVADSELADPTLLFCVESLEAAEGGELCEDNVLFGDFLIWDARGFRVNATVERGRPHWLKLTSTGIQDMQGLLEALSRYARAVGLPWEDVKGLGPAEALKRIKELENCQRQERSKKRPWYQFWLRG